ncbi:MAG: hypothetical protein AABX38_03870 [Candidatus Micrarchaeota archaeon]
MQTIKSRLRLSDVYSIRARMSAGFKSLIQGEKFGYGIAMEGLSKNGLPASVQLSYFNKVFPQGKGLNRQELGKLADLLKQPGLVLIPQIQERIASALLQDVRNQTILFIEYDRSVHLDLHAHAILLLNREGLSEKAADLISQVYNFEQIFSRLGDPNFATKPHRYPVSISLHRDRIFRTNPGLEKLGKLIKDAI